MNQSEWFVEKLLRMPARVYWLIPIFLFGLQFVFTYECRWVFTYEDLAESVRNVFWMDHHTLYDGISCSLTWYGFLLAVYKIFGFSLYTAKYVRLVFQLCSLFALACLLKRWLGARVAWIALLAWGTSPTLLAMNIVQTGFGVDLQMVPIGILLAQGIGSKKKWVSVVSLGALSMLVMFTCLVYSSAVLYLPTIAILACLRLGRRKDITLLQQAVLSLFCFLLPLALALLYLKDPRLALNDPVTRSGVFRGGGHLSFEISSIMTGVARTLRDLFVEGKSYTFELAEPEFGHLAGTLPFLFVLFFGVGIWRHYKKFRTIVVLSFFTICTGLLIPNLAANSPGLRRSTVVLAAFYTLFSLACYTLRSKRFESNLIRPIGLFLCLLLPLHHLAVYNTNLRQPAFSSAPISTPWFKIKPTPEQSLEYWLNFTASGSPLDCKAISIELETCRFSEIYAILAGYRLWNGLESTPIRAVHPITNKTFELSIGLWERYELLH
jgi:hypothetical protein